MYEFHLHQVLFTVSVHLKKNNFVNTNAVSINYQNIYVQFYLLIITYYLLTFNNFIKLEKKSK